ncbi:XRE family transcriptional regulator [Polynucleobacter sp. es-GGE-1]|jgi:antitoxin HicB|uniref:XRE family transcriptional regulator n=1 Tax=unclassified Polynucleobacter TaxID=2640945 RepID=UPI001C0BEC41|nr:MULTISPECIES: XRE family transcriptional regulator [unclassified Polynucleobacter]MBU3635118.1 XRE family transcriptional regulator [Polynucleobacter sp. es-GGE-1]MEA9600417.1 XRE family transcriptional regulator [Polynucleobacter sp. AP-Sanab-80-C2]
MKKKNIGSKFDDFLREESLLEESTAIAVKRVIAWQIEREMEKQNLTKTSMAKKMHTSRAALNRLLDESDTSLTLITLASAATALGKIIKFELKAA